MPARPPLPLEDPAPPDWAAAPFFEETRDLFRCVRDQDFDRLAALCDDDFGIVDLGPSGESIPCRTRAEWESWFRSLFATLSAMNAATDTEIEAYDALVRGRPRLQRRQVHATAHH